MLYHSNSMAGSNGGTLSRNGRHTSDIGTQGHGENALFKKSDDQHQEKQTSTMFASTLKLRINNSTNSKNNTKFQNRISASVADAYHNNNNGRHNIER